MLYRVLAHSRETGKKMSLELEAASKAAAEKEAKRQNLQVIRVEPASESEDAPRQPWKTLNPRQPRRIPWLFLLLLMAAGAIYYFWPLISEQLSARLPHAPRSPATTAP